MPLALSATATAHSSSIHLGRELTTVAQTSTSDTSLTSLPCGRCPLAEARHSLIRKIVLCRHSLAVGSSPASSAGIQDCHWLLPLSTLTNGQPTGTSSRT